MADDLQAIRLLKKGDLSGLEALVSRYQVKAIRSAFLILNDSQLAEDVVQETFLRVIRRIHGFDENRPFGPYLLKSVVNAALDKARKETKRDSHEARLETIENFLRQTASVENQIEFNQLKSSLRHALAQLPPRQRAAVVMRYYLGMGEKEMAETLTAAPGTVKWLLFTAREKLRILLAGERGSK
jgi:RNA polymerase sigma-70 factor (ECF subfamily)